jgi:SPP1 family predicted phage head-tail adaptor
MHAGRLDRRITILRATTAANDFNELVQTWTDIATVWAEAKPVMDGEKIRAGETLALKSYRFTIRYSSDVADIDPRDRLTFDGRTYDVQNVKEVGRREGLEITATARAETP